MPKAEEKKEEQKEWTPDQPLEDAEDEAEVQRRHKAQRRMKFLEEQTEKNGKGGTKKVKEERRSIW